MKKINTIVPFDSPVSLRDSIYLCLKDEIYYMLKDKKLPAKRNEKKSELAERLYEAMNDKRTIERYFLIISEIEEEALKQSLTTKDGHFSGQEAFPVLETAGYVYWDLKEEVYFVPKEVQDFYREISKSVGFKTRHHQMQWLFACITTACMLYVITPVEVLNQLIMQDKSCHIKEEDIIPLLQSMPPDVTNLKFSPPLIMADNINENMNEILALQANKPFYIPTYSEIIEGPSLWIMETDAGYAFEDFLIDNLDIDEEDAWNITLNIGLMIMSDAPIPIIISQIVQNQIIPDEKEVDTFFNLLADFNNNTRRIINRGFTSNEIAEIAERDNCKDIISGIWENKNKPKAKNKKKNYKNEIDTTKLPQAYFLKNTSPEKEKEEPEKTKESKANVIALSEYKKRKKIY